MKKFAKVLLTLVLAVAFVLPMTVVVFAGENDPFDTLSTRDSYTKVDSSVDSSYVFYDLHNEKTSLTFSELKTKLIQKSNNVRRIVAFTPEGDELGDDNNLATGDTIKIQSITQNGEAPPTYEDVKSYTFVLYCDVNKDGRVDVDDYEQIVRYVRGVELPTDLIKKALKRGSASYVINLSGDSAVQVNASGYELRIGVTPRTTASYIQFEVKYPSFFTYKACSYHSDMDDWAVDITNDADAKTLKINAYKDDFDGIQANVSKRIANIEFNFITSTATGTEESFTVNSAKVEGVSNYGEQLSGGAVDFPVSVGTITPTAPTLNSKNSSSITINTVSGYQYYCSTSSAAPSSTASWYTSSGSTITFSLLEPGTTYYIYYRRNSNDTAYLMDGAVKTDNPAKLKGPKIEDSDTTSITVDLSGSFTHIYFSPNSREPNPSSTWINLESGSGSISGIGSFSVDRLAETVKFSGLSGGRYYIFGKTAAGVVSDPTVWAPTPDITNNQVTVSENAVLLPFASVYRYSLDGQNYFSAITKTNITSSGSIYIQREEVNGDPNIAAIRGLEKNRDYVIYVCIFNENEIASKPYVVNVRTEATTPTTPPQPTPRSQSQIYVAIEYNKSLSYRINGSSWTAAFTTYPTITNMITLGNYAYYFSSSTDPTFIIFTKLTPDTAYTIDAKFADDAANTTNISSVTTRTIVCNHSYGPKVYIGSTLNYTQTCSICGSVKTGTDTPTHTHAFETVTVPSTCTTHGYTQQVCKADNYVLPGSRVELPLVPHTEARRVKTQPTCTNDGVAEIYCSVCGTVIRTEPIAATGHRYELATSTVQPTCTSKGYEIILQRCTVCGDEKEVSRQEIPALGHDAEWVTTVEPTVTSEGRKELICSRCGEVLETEVIPKLINYTKNANGTGTYEISVTDDKALVTDAAKLAIADGDASVKIVFPEGVSVELDPAMAVAFLRNNSYINIKKLTSDGDASGNLAKAGFSSSTHTIYEITAENAVIANGKATVTVVYNASAEGGAVNVYFVDAQGKKTKMNSTYADGKLTFETTHFSTYVVEQGKAKGSSAGLVIAIIAIVAVLLATGGTFGYMVYTSKKTKKRKFNF